jgi:hypothetical protein
MRWKVIYTGNEIIDFISGQNDSKRSKIFNWIDKLEELGPNLPRPYADYLKDGIYELRIKLSGNQIRILYFFCYKEFIILARYFNKKSNRVPEKEIELTKVIKKDFLKKYDEDTLRRLYDKDI